jgi:hypothetical protein
VRNVVVGNAAILRLEAPEPELWPPMAAATDLAFGSMLIYASKYVPDDSIYIFNDRLLHDFTWSFGLEIPDFEVTRWFVEKIMMLAKMRQQLSDHLAELVRETEERLFG